MNISSFARIRNAKPLLLTPEKRVMHFPKTNKVHIDYNVNHEPKYRENAIEESKLEYLRAEKIAKLPQKITPKVDSYGDRGVGTYNQV